MSCKLTVQLDGAGLHLVFLVPRCFSNILLPKVQSCTLVTIMTPLFFSLGSLSLGLTSICLRVLLPLKCVWIPNLLQVCLMPSPKPWTYRMTMCPILGTPPGVIVACLLPLFPLVSCDVLPTWLLPLSSQLSFISLFCILFMVHLGYLHLTSASLRCCNSSFKSPGVVQTDLALWVSVPMTLYLADMLWWLSHC